MYEANLQPVLVRNAFQTRSFFQIIVSHPDELVQSISMKILVRNKANNVTVIIVVN